MPDNPLAVAPSSARIPPFTLRQLAYLIEAADAGTVVEAARRLHVSSSAMSDALSELERGFGVRLCVRRRSQGLVLTAEGRRVVAASRALLRDARALVGDAAGEQLVGRIAVGCLPTLSAAVLPPLLAEFGGQHPGVELEIHEMEQPELRDAIDRGHLDAAFVYDYPAGDDPRRATVIELLAHVIVPPTHRLAEAPTVTLEDLVDEDLILLESASERTLSLFSMRGLRPRVLCRTTSIEAVRTLVGRGLGYSVLAQRQASGISAEGRALTRVEIAPRPAVTAVNMIWPQHAEHSRHIRALIAFARRGMWDTATT